MRDYLITAFIIVAIVICSGCAGFSGKREVSFKLSIMNNSVEWSSTCDGGYQEKVLTKTVKEKPESKP